MEIDLSFIQKTNILPNIELKGFGKNNIELIDCIDCDNCYTGTLWIPDGQKTAGKYTNDCDCNTYTDCARTRDCDYDCDCGYDCDCDYNCDCDNNYNCDCDYDCDCDCNYDYICDCYDCELCDGDSWYPGGWEGLCG